MAWIPCEETFVPNTRMQKVINSSGDHTQYVFTPEDGYVLHLKRDEVEYEDPDTGETTLVIMFARGNKTVRADYDFDLRVNDVYTYTDENGMTVSIPIEKIGPEELYTLPDSVVPTDQIYGTGTDHEVMSAKADTETN